MSFRKNAIEADTGHSSAPPVPKPVTDRRVRCAPPSTDRKNATCIPVEQLTHRSLAENGTIPQKIPSIPAMRPKVRASFVEWKYFSWDSPLPTMIQTSGPKALRLIPPAALNLPLAGAVTSTHEENQFVDRYKRYDGQLEPFEQWMA